MTLIPITTPSFCESQCHAANSLLARRDRKRLVWWQVCPRRPLQDIWPTLLPLRFDRIGRPMRPARGFVHQGIRVVPHRCSRSPVLCIPDQGCSIAHHETQGTEVLPELSALADEVGRPRGACEGARGHRRSSPGATRRGEEGFLDLV